MPITKDTIDEIVNTVKRHSGIDPAIQQTEEGLLCFIGHFIRKRGLVDDLFGEYEKQSGALSSQIRIHPKYDDYLKSYLTQALTDATVKDENKDDLILSTTVGAIIDSALKQTVRQIEKIHAIERKKCEAAEMLLQVAHYLEEAKPCVSELLKNDPFTSNRLHYRLAELLEEYPRKKGDIYTVLKNRLTNSFIPDKAGADINISGIIGSLGRDYKMAVRSKEAANGK